MDIKYKKKNLIAKDLYTNKFRPKTVKEVLQERKNKIF